jgi:hypothetical protein
MAHAIEALIVLETDARAICDAIPGSRLVHGGAGRWLVPLTGPFDGAARDLRAGDPAETTPEQVAATLGGLIGRLATVGLMGPVVVAVTEYFGGQGTQQSAVIELGTLSHGPFVGGDAISRGLRLAGVDKGECADEFEAVGLHRWRFTDDIAGTETKR